MFAKAPYFYSLKRLKSIIFKAVLLIDKISKIEIFRVGGIVTMYMYYPLSL